MDFFQAFYARDCNFSDMKIKISIIFSLNKIDTVRECEGGRSYAMKRKNMNAGYSLSEILTKD